MNLKNMFELQKQLGQVGLFNYRGADRFNKLALALLVELGECANEWRGFKFWSKNQKPRTKAYRGPFIDPEDGEEYNPLLEEYVDGLHFVLELGMEIDYYSMGYNESHKQKAKTITDQFLLVMHHVNMMAEDDYFAELLHSFIYLGEMLGFTWEQIEEAYMAKNAINHQRQEQGY